MIVQNKFLKAAFKDDEVIYNMVIGCNDKFKKVGVVFILERFYQ